MQKLSGKYQVTNDFPADKICQMVFWDGFIERIKWDLAFLEQINGFQMRIHGTAKRLQAKTIGMRKRAISSILFIIWSNWDLICHLSTS